MKGRVILLDRIGDRAAAALMVDGRLADVLIDPAGDLALPGAIYRAVADRPLPGQGGITLSMGAHKGYLRQAKGISFIGNRAR